MAIFAVKWQFSVTGSTSPPFKPWIVHYEATFLLSVGVYLLVSGEIFAWRRQLHRYSNRTSLAAMSAFLTAFSAKWAYAYQPMRGYYPPFNEETLGLVFLALGILTLYFLLVGEYEFWRQKSK